MAFKRRGKQTSTRLHSAAAGYYEHGVGSRYINPIGSGTAFPGLVELHESMHECLALANSTDGLARLFAGVVEWGSDELNQNHKASINALFQAIYENSVYTQEFYATYVSFILFSSRNPQDVAKARRELPRSYKNILDEAEAVFGPIGTGKTSDDIIIVVVNACAIAAMNVRYPKEISFDNIDHFTKLVDTNSPDARFRLIIQAIIRDGGETLFSIQNIEQSDVFNWLRTNVREVDFFVFAEEPMCFRDWAACLVRDAPRFGYRFLRDKEVTPHPEDSVIERIGAKLEHPGMESWEPLDLSLKHMRFASGSLEELWLIGQACALQAIGLFVHVFIFPGDTIARLFAFAWSSTKTALVTPFSITCSIDELIAALRGIPIGGVTVKIDERMDQTATIRLTETGHPCFVLSHDTRPKHVIEVVRPAAKEQRVYLGRLVLSENFSVMLFQMERDGWCYLTPATPVGIESVVQTLENENNVVFPRTENELFAVLKVDLQRLHDLCYTCYVPLEER